MLLNVFKAYFGTLKVFGSQKLLSTFTCRREYPKTSNEQVTMAIQGTVGASPVQMVSKRNILWMSSLQYDLISRVQEARDFCSWDISKAFQSPSGLKHLSSADRDTALGQTPASPGSPRWGEDVPASWVTEILWGLCLKFPTRWAVLVAGTAASLYKAAPKSA